MYELKYITHEAKRTICELYPIIRGTISFMNGYILSTNETFLFTDEHFPFIHDALSFMSETFLFIREAFFAPDTEKRFTYETKRIACESNRFISG
jgi:hypothetical protein